MIEGESGILATAPPWDRPLYEPSKRRLTWRNGATAIAYSADEPERLGGPQHDAAWCDELGAWRYPEAWDMLMFGLRLGKDPRCVVTTTPRPTKFIRELIKDPTVASTRGSSYENRGNLASAFFDQIAKNTKIPDWAGKSLMRSSSRIRQVHCGATVLSMPPGRQQPLPWRELLWRLILRRPRVRTRTKPASSSLEKTIRVRLCAGRCLRKVPTD